MGPFSIDCTQAGLSRGWITLISQATVQRQIGIKELKVFGPPFPPPALPPPAPPPAPPVYPPGSCDNTCADANNGVCTDGGPGGVGPVSCAWGTDCADCGLRGFSPPALPPPVTPPPPFFCN